MLVDKNGKEITASFISTFTIGCKVLWDDTLCDIDWVGESHRKEVQELCAKHMEVVDIRHSNESPYSIPYGQHYCPICYGQIDTGFKCIKCGKQFSPPKNNSSVTAKDERELI